MGLMEIRNLSESPKRAVGNVDKTDWEVTQPQSVEKEDASKQERKYIMEVSHEYASKGVAGAGLGLGM